MKTFELHYCPFQEICRFKKDYTERTGDELPAVLQLRDDIIIDNKGPFIGYKCIALEEFFRDRHKFKDTECSYLLTINRLNSGLTLKADRK